MGTPDALAELLGPPTAFDDLSLAQLRRRRSFKWTAYPSHVLPAFVAEMDLPLAPAVAAALRTAIADGDCGYASEDESLPTAFAAFAARRWSWSADPARMVLVPDVMAGVARAIEFLTEPGDAVIINPPVYAPFRRTIERLGRTTALAPVVPAGNGWQLDHDAIERALAADARAVLLCNPHNPTGNVPTAVELQAIVDAAARHGAGIISDEVHAPLTLPGRGFVPLLSLGECRAFVVSSASKTWNVAGLKCALLVAGDGETAAQLTRLPVALRHPGHLGVLAASAAFTSDAEGDDWLDSVRAHIGRQHERARALLAAALPAIRVPQVDAGYLSWLDCRDLGLDDDPAAVFLERGDVALSPGLEFGSQGAGFARLNVATSGTLLHEAIRRMGRAVNSGRDSASDQLAF